MSDLSAGAGSGLTLEQLQRAEAGIIDDGESTSSERRHLIKHRTVRRYKIGRFIFQNYVCDMSEDDYQEFLRVIGDKNYPQRERMQFVEVNREALAALEQPLAPVARGAQQAHEVKSPKILSGDQSSGGAQPLNLDNLQSAESQADNKPKFNFPK